MTIANTLLLVASRHPGLRSGTHLPKTGTTTAAPRSGRMDEKSINLWRQIEGCRRAKKRLERRGKGAAPLASTVANDPVWTPRDIDTYEWAAAHVETAGPAAGSRGCARPLAFTGLCV